jgi:hypothetical protein
MEHSLGWVQNPSDFQGLKNVVGVLEYNSKQNKEVKNYKLPLILHNQLIKQSDYDLFIDLLNKEDIRIPFTILKGKGSSSRANALCSGITQASLKGQKDKVYKDFQGKEFTTKKLYVDDWSSVGFLRWAISLGLIDCDKDDLCFITDLGRAFIETEDNSEEETNILRTVFLSYPPMCRILQLLSSGEALTKFDLGSQLGFKGEKGFTSIPLDYFVAMCSVNPKNNSNLEGDSDKYARGIASWATKVGWVTSIKKTVCVTYLGIVYTKEMQAFKITAQGMSDFKRTVSNSSKAALPKYVFYEMLATKSSSVGVKYLRYRRANLINFVSRGDKTLSSIQKHLKSLGLDESVETIVDELNNLKNIGLNVRETSVNGVVKYKIIDKIEKLMIPEQGTVLKDNIIELKDNLRAELKNISHDYLELVDLAYSEATSKEKKAADAREFEFKTADLFINELDFKGMHLGDSDKPDVIISYSNYGTIIDNKSYKDGFSVDKHNADEMSRYINQNKQRIPNIPPNEWWRNFDINVTDFTFLFITSFLTGNFRSNLEEISMLTGVNGGAIGVKNLLYLSDKLKGNEITYEDFFTYFNNDEIVVS